MIDNFQVAFSPLQIIFKVFITNQQGQLLFPSVSCSQIVGHVLQGGQDTMLEGAHITPRNSYTNGSKPPCRGALVCRAE